MSVQSRENQFQDCNVIYSECCFTMGARFARLGRKYKKMGKLDLAEKLEKEAVIQLDAWRKAKNELKQVS